MYRTKRVLTRNNYYYIVIAVLIGVVFVGVLTWWLRQPADVKDKEVVDQEFTQLKVVQFYLHLPTGDVIINRGNPKFAEFQKLVESVITDVKDTSTEPALSTKGDTNSIKGIERSTVSLTTWLMEPQKVSSRITAKGTELADKFNNRVIETDRILIIMGGKQAGSVYTKKANGDIWTSWQTSGKGIKEMVEVVRKGGI